MAESETGRLELVADPSAVSRARAWLTSRLDNWSPDAVATVQLLVSELVTNAILHTDDMVEVTARKIGSGVTVEVTDRNPSKPVVKTYGRDAATGRGLHLVEALADAWGVRGDEDHKAVWFRVVDHASHDEIPSARRDSPSLADLPTWSGRDADATTTAAGSDGPYLTVCLNGLPVAVYLAAEEHHDALMREFALLLQASAGADPGVPARLIELATGLVEQFGSTNERRRAQVEVSRRAGRDVVDLELVFPASAEHTVLVVADHLDEVDVFCEQGVLLTPPSTPAVAAFRRWYSEQIVHQLQGRRPRPWPYPLETA